MAPVTQLGANPTTRRATLAQLRTTVHDQRSIHVRDFGAVGNGTTNDAPAIQAAINSLKGAGGGVVGVVVFTRAFARQAAPRGVIPIRKFTGRSDRLIFASYEFGDDFFRGISGRVAPWSLRRPAGDFPDEISGYSGPFSGDFGPVSEEKRTPSAARPRLFPRGQVHRAPASPKSRKNSRCSCDKPIDGKRGESHRLWSLRGGTTACSG